MLVVIPQALAADALKALRTRLDAAADDPEGPWVDGRVSAGWQGAPVKSNRQLDERSALAADCQRLVLDALERHPRFISAVLPNEVYPPMFNRYGPGMYFGPHVDGSGRLQPRTGRKLRTDVSATLFLNEPSEYDGGELVVHDAYGAHRVKLAAGDLVVYPATSLHEVTPVTRGTRLASFFWVQSLVRDDAQRAMLFDLDNAIQRLNLQGADDDARRALVGLYHNLMRQWSET